jgi:hypothetical protein
MARQRLGMDAAGDDLTVDKHAIAVENDEIAGNGIAHVLSLSRDFSSSGTQYNSSR